MKIFSTAILAMFLIATACDQRNYNEDIPRQFPTYADLYEGSLSPVRGQAQKFSLALISSPLAEKESQTYLKGRQMYVFYEATTEHHLTLGNTSLAYRDSHSDELNLRVDLAYMFEENKVLNDPLILQWRSFVKSLSLDNPCPDTRMILMYMEARLVDNRIEGVVKALLPNRDACYDYGERLDTVATVRLTKTRPADFSFISPERIETQVGVYQTTIGGDGVGNLYRVERKTQ